MYKNLFFDCDGTLLQTLQDIRFAINTALKECGYDYEFSLKECHYLIGDGADNLVRRALKDKGQDEEAFLELRAHYLPLYKEHQNDHAKPFNGMPEVLKMLKDKGCRLFVITNKPDALAKTIVELHFGKGIFDEIVGARDGVPVKPDPALCNVIFNRYGFDKKDCLYIGDGKTDALTAQNSNMDLCLCLWGYGFYKPDLLEMATYTIKKPKELIKIALS